MLHFWASSTQRKNGQNCGALTMRPPASAWHVLALLVCCCILVKQACEATLRAVVYWLVGCYCSRCTKAQKIMAPFGQTCAQNQQTPFEPPESRPEHAGIRKARHAQGSHVCSAFQGLKCAPGNSARSVMSPLRGVRRPPGVRQAF